MRALRLVYLTCLVCGYLILVAGQPLSTWASGGSASTPQSTAPTPQAASGLVHVLTFDSDVNPVTASYVQRGIQTAEEADDAMLVIQLNTPGGQLDSMSKITQAILNSKVPVMVYVSPSGAWAASAGVFITYAAHVAVMAPGSSIGAAHPIFEGTTGSSPPSNAPDSSGATPTPDGSSEAELLRKITNFSVANLRSIATLRGRNAAWAEQAIRESVALGADEAVREHVVDYTAPTLAAALDQADGRTTLVGSGETVTIHTKGVTTVPLPMTSIESFLLLLTNSTLAYSLITLGGLALTAEVFNPGLIFPGVFGVIMLLLGLVALGQLPVNLTGVAMIIFAFILFIADLFMTAHGILTAGGVTALVLGGLLLIDTSQAPGLPTVSIWSIVGLAATIGGAFFFGIYKAMETRRTQPVTGREGLIGDQVEVRTDLAPSGTVFAEGAIWQARSLAGPVAAGQLVTIAALDGLTLLVRPAPDALPVADSPGTVPLADEA
jgi:membrane-bound serine protease (ClpP class)